MEKSLRTLDGGPRTALHLFVTRYRADIIARTKEKLAGRPTPADLAGDLAHGVPVFLTQLVETLRREGQRGAVRSERDRRHGRPARRVHAGARLHRVAGRARLR